MARLIYSSEALADLERFIEFLLPKSPAAASAAISAIRSAIEILATHPRIGRRVLREQRELVISFGSTGYVALYVHDPAFAVVRILRIRHQREAGYRD